MLVRPSDPRGSLRQPFAGKTKYPIEYCGRYWNPIPSRLAFEDDLHDDLELSEGLAVIQCGPTKEGSENFIIIQFLRALLNRSEGNLPGADGCATG